MPADLERCADVHTCGREQVDQGHRNAITMRRTDPLWCLSQECAGNPVSAQQPPAVVNRMSPSTAAEASPTIPAESVPYDAAPLAGESGDSVLSVDSLLELMQATEPSSEEAQHVARELLKELLRCVRRGAVSTPPPAIYGKLVEAAQCLGVGEELVVQASAGVGAELRRSASE